jgi:hypothetical protein
MTTPNALPNARDRSGLNSRASVLGHAERAYLRRALWTK